MTIAKSYFVVFQSVTRLTNVFKEQFDLFFSEKMVALMVEKTGVQGWLICARHHPDMSSLASLSQLLVTLQR